MDKRIQKQKEKDQFYQKKDYQFLLHIISLILSVLNKIMMKHNSLLLKLLIVMEVMHKNMNVRNQSMMYGKQKINPYVIFYLGFHHLHFIHLNNNLLVQLNR